MSGGEEDIREDVDYARECLRAADQIRHAYEAFYQEPIADDVSLLETPRFEPGRGVVGSFETQEELRRRLDRLIQEKYPHLSPYTRDKGAD